MEDTDPPSNEGLYEMTGPPLPLTGKHFKWLVVGAGPVGSHLVLSLLRKGLAGLQEIALLDPAAPLSSWRHRTRNCGMTFLRSTCVHHIGESSSALRRFHKQSGYQGRAWAGKYQKPSLKLFNSHCEELLRSSRVLDCHYPYKVETLERADRGFLLQTGGGTVTAEAVVLAQGPVFRKEIPTWLAPAEVISEFLLDQDFDVSRIPHHARIAVIGGGMTAVQAALGLASKHRVTLLTRRPVEVSEFDSPSSWMGPVGRKFLNQDPTERMAQVRRVRHPGTVTSAVSLRLQQSVEKGRLQMRQLERPRCQALSGGKFRLRDGDWEEAVDLVLLGTGFQTELHPLQKFIAERLNAPIVDPCYPVLDSRLQWLPNLYVAGCGAEVQIGPTAPNLLGARMAVQRILGAQAHDSPRVKCP